MHEKHSPCLLGLKKALEAYQTSSNVTKSLWQQLNKGERENQQEKKISVGRKGRFNRSLALLKEKGKISYEENNKHKRRRTKDIECWMNLLNLLNLYKISGNITLLLLIRNSFLFESFLNDFSFAFIHFVVSLSYSFLQYLHNPLRGKVNVVVVWETSVLSSEGTSNSIHTFSSLSSSSIFFPVSFATAFPSQSVASFICRYSWQSLLSSFLFDFEEHLHPRD